MSIKAPEYYKEKLNEQNSTNFTSNMEVYDNVLSSTCNNNVNENI